MNSRSRIHSVAWAGALAISGACLFTLMLQVTGVKSDIAETEKDILSVKNQIATLETEFQTRARQQQLARWNDVDFGYVAPQANQFVTDGAQLAALGREAVRGEEQVLMADASEAASAIGHNEAREIRIASAEAQGGNVRQLVARDAAIPARKETLAAAKPVRVALAVDPAAPKALSGSERAAIARRLAPAPADPASQFAQNFDFDRVVAEAGAKRP